MGATLLWVSKNEEKPLHYSEGREKIYILTTWNFEIVLAFCGKVAFFVAVSCCPVCSSLLL